MQALTECVEAQVQLFFQNFGCIMQAMVDWCIKTGCYEDRETCQALGLLDAGEEDDDDVPPVLHLTDSCIFKREANPSV